MISIIFTLTFCVPFYNSTTDQKRLEVVGFNDAIIREDVIKHSSIDKLEYLIIGKGIISLGTSCFESAKQLSEVYVSSDLKILGDSCFKYCRKLTSLVLPEGFEKICSWALATTGLIEITLPSTLNSVDPFLSFIYCDSFTKFKMPIPGIFSVDSKETMLIYNKTKAFNVASGVSNIQFTNEIEVIGTSFANQRHVKTLKFSNATNLHAIENGAFSGSWATRFELPEGLISIHDGALGSQATYVSLPSTLLYIGYIFNPDMEIANIDSCPGVIKDEEGLLFNQNKTRILLIPNTVQNLKIPKELINFDTNLILQSKTLKDIIVEPGNPVYFGYKCGLYNSTSCEILAFPKNISRAVIAANCTAVSAGAFRGTYVKEIEFEDGGKLLREIGYASFELCDNLISISIPDSVTTISHHSFRKSGIQNVRFSKSIRNILTYAFGYSDIKRVNLSECVNLKSLSDHSFEACNSLIEVILPNNLVALYSNVFGYCTLLKGIKIPRTVHTISDECFIYCSELKNIEFESNSSLKTLNFGVLKESGIERIEIPANVTEIMQGALSYCPHLSEITFEPNSKLNVIRKGAFTGNNLTQMLILPSEIQFIDEQSLSEMYGLQNFDFDGKSSKFKIINGVIFSHNGLELIVFPAGKKEYTIEGNVSKIANSAFFRCINLIELLFYPSVPLKTIGENTFMECSSLAKLNFPAAVESLEANCFCGCTSISSVSFAKGSLLKVLGSGAFNGCKKLNKIEFKGNASLSIVDCNSFSGCVSLASFSFPKGVHQIGSSAFSNCLALAKISFESGSELLSVGESAFEGCASLCEFSFPPNIQAIHRDAFRGCNRLTRVIYCGSNEITVIDGSIFTGVKNVLAYVSPLYPDDCALFGELKAERILDISCNFPTETFTTPLDSVGLAGALAMMNGSLTDDRSCWSILSEVNNSF